MVPWNTGLDQRTVPFEIVILQEAEDLVLAWVARQGALEPLRGIVPE